MLTFWIVAALLAAVAAACIVVPLLRHRPPAGLTTREANIAVLRGQRQDVDADIRQGLLPADARDEVLAEITARAAEDVPPAGADSERAPGRAWVAALVAGLAIPVGALVFYGYVGSPAATDAQAVAAASAPRGEGQAPFSDAQIEAMVESLDERMKSRPDDVEGWTLLARSLAAMGRTDRAVAAYRHLAKLQPESPAVLADLADLLALEKNRDLSGEPTQLVLKALAIDPRHPKSLALAATARFNAGEFAPSIVLWERLYDVVPPESEDAQEIRRIVEDVRSRAAAAGKPQPVSRIASAAGAAAAPRLAPAAPAASGPPPPVASAPPPPPLAGGAGSIAGTVRLAPALASLVAAGDTLFIFARAPEGSRMPLAILRAGAGELPRAFELTDAMGMAPGVRLSGAASVVIEARISKAGNAVAQPGDLVGVSAPVAPGARGVAITIDRVIP